MPPRNFSRYPIIWKSLLTGLALFICLASVHSFRAAETPPWKTEAQPGPAPSRQPLPNPAESGTAETEPFRFISYNVKNWLVSYQTKEKTKKSKTAVISLLETGNPDIIGLSEIGSVADIKEIQTALKARNLDLPFLYHTGGTDKIRHLGIISKFPIIRTTKPNLNIEGEPYQVRRGILDVEIQIGHGTIRFIGLHLKSKRPIPEFDQATMRHNEARVVRSHLDSIFEKHPNARIVVYGDFNDTTRAPSTRTIFGRYNSKKAIRPVNLKDSRGENWTHNWNHQDIYSRIDFVATSRSLSPKVDRENSRILDLEFWEDASDHRPLLLQIN